MCISSQPRYYVVCFFTRPSCSWWCVRIFRHRGKLHRPSIRRSRAWTWVRQHCRGWRIHRIGYGWPGRLLRRTFWPRRYAKRRVSRLEFDLIDNRIKQWWMSNWKRKIRPTKIDEILHLTEETTHSKYCHIEIETFDFPKYNTMHFLWRAMMVEL